MVGEARPYANTDCPYCGVALDPLPWRKTKCPACARPIYVRAGPDGYTYLLQDGDRHVLEEAWAEYREREDFTQKMAAFLLDFEALEAAMRARDPGCSPRDVYWAGMNRLVLDSLGRGDWHTARLACSDMALQARKESDGDRALILHREALHAQLMDHLRAARVARKGRPDIRVDIVGCDCAGCSVGPHRRLWAQDELAALHLPHRQCRKDGWCACEYVPVAE
jgi:hypothetical protein